MRRFAIMTVFAGCALIVAGCASGSSTAGIDNVLRQMDQTVNQLESINLALRDAMALEEDIKKLETDLANENNDENKKRFKKELETKTESYKNKLIDAEGSIETLKKTASTLLDIQRQAEEAAPTEDERKALIKKYQGRLNSTLADLADKRRDLNATLEKARKGGLEKEKFDKLQELLRQAEGEYENIARR